MLEIRNIHKQFGSQTALAQVNLKIAKGEFFSLLGPSGCGKSTLLRILAGFETQSAGEIYWNGERIDQMPARERPFNMVFQRYALFPHLSVFENVAFGLRIRRTIEAQIKRQVMEALDLVGLDGFAERDPETLSGGQSQRVALARAFVNKPACVLLDEPLSALDQKLREHMHTELRILQKHLGMTFIFVTHDQEEAMLLSDRIAVMNKGVIEQVSAPRELYESPRTLFCARFVGRRNELSGQASMTLGSNDWLPVEINGSGQVHGKSACDHLSEAIATGRTPSGVSIFVRSENVRLARSGESTANMNSLQGHLVRVIYRGQRSEVIVRVGDELFLRSMADITPESGWHEGDEVSLIFSPNDTHLYSADPS